MSIASKALSAVNLKVSKQYIEDRIMVRANQGFQYIELSEGEMRCNPSYLFELVEFLRHEGLTVRVEEYEEKPRGMASMLADDDEMVKRKKYVISW